MWDTPRNFCILLNWHIAGLKTNLKFTNMRMSPITLSWWVLVRSKLLGYATHTPRLNYPFGPLTRDPRYPGQSSLQIWNLHKIWGRVESYRVCSGVSWKKYRFRPKFGLAPPNDPLKPGGIPYPAQNAQTLISRLWSQLAIPDSLDGSDCRFESS